MIRMVMAGGDHIHVHPKKIGEHRRILARTHRAAFVVSETQMRGVMSLSNQGRNSTVENINLNRKN